MKVNEKVYIAIIIVLVGISGFFAYKYFENQNAQNKAVESVLSRGRDTERRTDIQALSTQLEVYFADNGGYPDGITSGYQLNTTTLPGLDAEALIAPGSNPIIIRSKPSDAADNNYHYHPIECSGGLCEGFELGFTNEQDSSLYVKNNLN